MTKQDLGKNVWYDPDANGYIGFDITSSIPTQTQQTVEGISLLPKDEYHCSLIAVRLYVENREKEQEIADSLRNYLEKHDLHFTGLGTDRYVCRKEDRMTIIAPVKIDGVDELRDFVTTLIPDYQPPFTHVTLLKSEATEFGIGINSMDELDQYCQKLELS
jgi:hypothetical protein